jgi:hypothetical protein
MSNPAQHSTSILRSNLRATACALALLCTLTIVAMQSARAQTFTVLHDFTAGADGSFPEGITLDRAGNLYGTTEGYESCGSPPPPPGTCG